MGTEVKGCLVGFYLLLNVHHALEVDRFQGVDFSRGRDVTCPGRKPAPVTSVLVHEQSRTVT